MTKFTVAGNGHAANAKLNAGLIADLKAARAASDAKLTASIQSLIKPTPLPGKPAAPSPTAGSNTSASWTLSRKRNAS